MLSVCDTLTGLGDETEVVHSHLLDFIDYEIIFGETDMTEKDFDEKYPMGLVLVIIQSP